MNNINNSTTPVKFRDVNETRHYDIKAEVKTRGLKIKAETKT